MILEAVILFVKPNQATEFENNFRLASAIICKMNGLYRTRVAEMY